jgi:hypothetical protein
MEYKLQENVKGKKLALTKTRLVMVAYAKKRIPLVKKFVICISLAM